MTSPRRLRVLLVDDHAVLREGLRALLETGDEGIEIAGESATTDHGLNAALALRPDVVLVDLSLPGRSVPQMIRQVREGSPKTKLIVLTAVLDELMLRETLAAGSSGYLLKDVSRRTLVAAIQDAVAGETILHREAQKLLGIGQAPPSKDSATWLQPLQIAELFG
jgi:DNA-binding NarL/FixJ family response regulator